jgi:hypothetical protein
MANVSDVVHQEGVKYITRKHGLSWLVKDGLLDAKIALVMSEA